MATSLLLKAWVFQFTDVNISCSFKLSKLNRWHSHRLSVRLRTMCEVNKTPF